MGIIEAIQEEIKKQATEEGAEKKLKENINTLYRKEFTVEAISEMLEVPLKFVKNAIK
jgi:DNA-binding transcriptional regulator GbsR (MarR family)